MVYRFPGEESASHFRVEHPVDGGCERCQEHGAQAVAQWWVLVGQSGGEKVFAFAASLDALPPENPPNLRATP